MRIIDTYSGEVNDMLNQYTPRKGLIYQLINIAVLEGDEDISKFFSREYSLTTEYYLNYSGQKKISNLFEKMIEIRGKEQAELDMARIIWDKFAVFKWNSLCKSFYLTYNVSDEFSKHRLFNADNSDIINREGNGTTKTETATHLDTTINEDVYGFNSTNKVPDEVTTTKLYGQPNGNFEDINNSNTIKEDKTIKRNEDELYTGREIPTSVLIDKEIEFRNKRILYNIIFDDIDSVLTIGMY